MTERLRRDQREPELTRVTFRKLELQEILEDRQLESLGLTHLYAEGYGIHLNGADILKHTGFEYRSDILNTRIAEVDGKAVASLTLQMLRDKKEDSYGSDFWGGLQEEDFLLAENMKAVSPLIVHVAGIVTLPEWRKKGLQRQLVDQSFESLRPAMVLGQSNSPEAVIARAKLFGEKGYRTFFGPYEVTPFANADLDTRPLEVVGSVINAYHRTAAEYVINGILSITGFPSVARGVSNTEGFSPLIKRAFTPLVEAQRVHPRRAFQSTLISIKNELCLAA